MIGIFSSAAWNNIGYIDWEPWLAQIFTRILRGFSLPVGKMQTSPQRYRYITRKIARWIVAMMGNGSACLTYLDDLLMAMKNFYHPSNTGKFQKNLFVQEKLTNFLSGAYFSPKVKGFVSAVVRALLHGNPVEALKCVLPKTCESIEKIMNHADTTELFINGKEDLELIWYLTLFSELVRARGDTLLIYKPMIMSIFHRSTHIVHKYSYEIVANAARDLLESLSYVYPIEYKLTIENLDEPFIDFLPIRVWGQPVDFDRFQMQYHIPNVDEIDFACEFVKTFLYSELTLLNEKMLKLSNHERSRSLTFVYNIALGYFHMIPRIESEQLADLVLSVVPYNSKYQFQTSTYMRESKFNENLRMRLVNDIGKLLDLLVENHSDDVSSMKKALKANMNFD
ncbi:unnamed protein product [Rotaria socialis]|uniref:Proteasome activator Blm10 middle HEAT repeats region domain-containing protein n=1 Tax=Rotaria socialis TaxID=392032 RepID=A0A821GQ04_9BILA|nr:unnamed protein product [Rotaria socialis]